MSDERWPNERIEAWINDLEWAVEPHLAMVSSVELLQALRELQQARAEIVELRTKYNVVMGGLSLLLPEFTFDPETPELMVRAVESLIETIGETVDENAALKAENKVLRDGAPKFIITEGKHV